MKTKKQAICKAALALSLAGFPALAQDGSWKFAVGPTYVNGFSDVVSFYEKEHNATSLSNAQIGLMFAPYYEWKSGMRFGFDLGPVAAIMGDISFVDVPIGVTFGMAFVPSSDVSPYARLGIRHHIANGDNVDSSSPGVFAAFGIDFSRARRVQWGLEVAVDTSSVKFRGDHPIYNPTTGRYGDPRQETIKPDKFMVNVHVIF